MFVDTKKCVHFLYATCQNVALSNFVKSVYFTVLVQIGCKQQICKRHCITSPAEEKPWQNMKCDSFSGSKNWQLGTDSSKSTLFISGTKVVWLQGGSSQSKQNS